MSEDEEGKPWSELHWAEKLWTGFWSAVGSLLCLALAALLVAVAVNETRWTFTRVNTERVCKAGQHSDCLTRTPGIVKSWDDIGFTVAIDRPPYRRHVKSMTGRAPAVGTRVVMEDWHGRLVSILDPARGRQRTDQWPNPRKDALEALAALAALLFIPALIAVNFLVDVVKRRKSDAAAQAAGVSEQHAQTS